MKTFKGIKLFSSVFCALTIFTIPAFSQSQEYQQVNEPVLLSFKYHKGDSYRILSTVEEDVFVNYTLDHHALIINRVSAQITDITQNGSGVHNVTYMTTESATGARSGASFEWGEEYESIFTRDKNGLFTIAENYFMPTVRDVPYFPSSPVKSGDTWSHQGYEAHDLRQSFKLETPFCAPFTANYTLLGKTTDPETSDTLYVIKCTYSLYTQTPVGQAKNTSYYQDYPVSMWGYSDELIFWDNEKGAIHHYTENFRIIMESAYGITYEFRGTSHAETTELIQTNTEENADEIQKQIDEKGLENVTVSRGEKGLTISLENIQFRPDSAVLMESEKAKLIQIAEILKSFEANDILIVGHTALAGTERQRQELSEERAKAVADYLIQLGVKDAYHIFTQGMGSKQPVASNSTEEGKAKNRRVEIIILDR